MSTRTRMVPALLALGGLVGCAGPTDVDDAMVGRELPAPTLDAPAGAAGEIRTAVLAGGCFWGIEAVFEHVRGVVSVVSGYAGGTAETARYDVVTGGTTDHAESVRIRYDAGQISYAKLLHVFFSVAHDGTQIDRQYPDIGRHYRSNIFHQTDAERDAARAYIAQLDAAKVLRRPIATRVDRLAEFYPAEEYHQNYLVGHQNELYIITYDLPKLAALKRLFPELYVADPVG